MRASSLAHGYTCLSPFLSPPGLGQSPNRLLLRQDEIVPSDDFELLFPEEEGNTILEAKGLGDIDGPSSTVSQWDHGRLPRACWEMATSEGPDRYIGGECTVAGIEVYNVTYNDCDEPWIVCRCPEAEDNLDTVVADLGRLPVAARENVRYVVMAPNNTSPDTVELEGAALYWAGDLLIYGNWSSVGLFVHEVAHNLDFWVATDKEDTLFSSTQDWRDVVDNDTCVADAYSQTSYTEAYAQAAVLLAYELNIEPLDRVVDDTCMSSVMEYLTETLGPYLTYVPDATCTMSNRFPYPSDDEICLDKDDEAFECEDNKKSEDGDDDNNNSSSSGDGGSDAPRAFALGAVPVLLSSAVLMNALGLFGGW